MARLVSVDVSKTSIDQTWALVELKQRLGALFAARVLVENFEQLGEDARVLFLRDGRVHQAAFDVDLGVGSKLTEKCLSSLPA